MLRPSASLPLRRLVFAITITLMAGCECGTDAPVDAGADGSIDASPQPDASVTLCAANAECDDGVYCNGAERCEPGAPSAAPDGCVAGDPPCSTISCDEDADACVCTTPDMDEDGFIALGCPGGDDCDDGDSNRYPGNVEVCDADGRDEDCDPSTLGGADADGDGFVSNICCNGDVCGDDCNDFRRDVFPGATELCNNVDDDCNGVVDDLGAFCPTGTCINNRCRATGWEYTWGNEAGPPRRGDPVAVDLEGNAYIGFQTLSALDIDKDGTNEMDPGYYVVSIDPVGRFRWVFREAPGAFGIIVGGMGAIGDDLALAVNDSLIWVSRSTGLEINRISVAEPGAEASGTVWMDTSEDTVHLAVAFNRSDGTGGTSITRRNSETGSIEARLELSDELSFVALAAGEGSVAITGAALSGSTPLPTASGSPSETVVEDGFLALLDGDLNVRWAVGDLPLSDRFPSVGPEGRVAIAGSASVGFDPPWAPGSWPSASSRRAYVAMFAPDGSFEWDWQHDGPDSDRFVSIDFDGRGGVIAAGEYTGTFSSPVFTRAAEGTDGIAVLFEAGDGLVLDTWHVGGEGDQGIRAVNGDLFGNFVMMGSAQEEVDLPSGSSIPAASGLDTWAIRVADAL